MDWEEHPASFRLSLVSRLARFADPEFHAKLRGGTSLNGASDFEDIIHDWDWGPREEGRDDGSLSVEEMEALLSFDRYLDETYDLDNRGEDGERWGWLVSSKYPVPECWRETVRQANIALAHFPDFDFGEWRERGYPIWD